MSSVFIDAAKKRSGELGVSGRVEFLHRDASDFAADEPFDIAACLGATWIGDGVPGTVDLLCRNVKLRGVMLIGHPYWRRPPPSRQAIVACGVETERDWLSLPELIGQMQSLGCDVVEMMLADQESWDRYVAAQWRNVREFVDANPEDDLTSAFRDELHTSPLEHTAFQREYLGWGMFVLNDR